MSLIYSALRAIEGEGAKPSARPRSRDEAVPGRRPAWWSGAALLAAAGIGTAFVLLGTPSPSPGSGQPERSPYAARAPVTPPATGSFEAMPLPVPQHATAASPPQPRDLTPPPATPPTRTAGASDASGAPRAPTEPAMPTAGLEARASEPSAQARALPDATTVPTPPAHGASASATPAIPQQDRVASHPGPYAPMSDAEEKAPALVVHRRGDPAPARNSPARQAATGPDPLRIQRHIAELEAAIATNDEAAGRAALAALEALLAPESLTLLRYQAWWAMVSGQDALAYQRYQSIADRLPGDENANLNLALLDWRAGRVDAARERIALLRLRNPQSGLIERHWRSMNQREM